MNGYLNGIHEVVPELLKDPKFNVVMDGSMSTFALYWAGSGKAHRAFSTVAVKCWKVCFDRHGSGAGAVPNNDAYERCMEDTCFPAGRQADLQVWPITQLLQDIL